MNDASTVGKPAKHRPAPLLLNTSTLRHLVSRTTSTAALPPPEASPPSSPSHPHYVARASSVPTLLYPTSARSTRRDTGVYADAPPTPMGMLGPDRSSSVGTASGGGGGGAMGLGLGFAARSASLGGLSGGMHNMRYSTPLTTGPHPSPLASHPPHLPVWRIAEEDDREGSMGRFARPGWI